MKPKTKIISTIAIIIVVLIIVALVSNWLKQTPYQPIYPVSNFNATGSDTQSRVATKEMLAGAPMQDEAVAPKPATERLIIRSGSLSVVSANVQKSVADVTAYVVGIGGFVVSSNVEGTADNPTAVLQVRVPVEKFQESVTRAEKSGLRVTSESLNGEDVTEDFVDTEARIKNLQASEAQFTEIMRRAVKISDVLEVQQQLERVRGQIDIAQGHKQYLEKSAKLSSLTIYFATDEGKLPVVNPADAWNPWTIVKTAFRSLVGFFQVIGSLIIWLIIFIPLWLVIALAVYGLRKFFRNIKTGK